jgi:hypothetical protein
VFYVRLTDKVVHASNKLWIKVSSVIQSLSVAHIKRKMSNLTITRNKCTTYKGFLNWDFT